MEQIAVTRLQTNLTNSQCQFTFRHRRRDSEAAHAAGDRCLELATQHQNTLCNKHRRRARFSNAAETNDDASVAASTADNSFPRIMTGDEERICVDEARRRTSPESFVMRSCITCGGLSTGLDLVYRSEKELMESRHLLQNSKYYPSVTHPHFLYNGAHSGLNGMVLDRRGFLNSDEVVEGAPLMVRLCKSCDKSLTAGRLPDLALANGLWSGVGLVPELSGLSWIEEKMIARCHISVQIQKCRHVVQWHIDGFHPQRKLQGNISTFPVEPTVALNKLPLSGNDMVGLVKVVFMSSRAKMSLQQACRLRFFIVRRRRVETALRWLILNNPLYQEVQLDEAVLSSLPEDGIPLQVYESITFCDKVVEDMIGHSRYDQPDEKEAEQGMFSIFQHFRSSLGKTLADCHRGFRHGSGRWSTSTM